MIFKRSFIYIAAILACSVALGQVPQVPKNPSGDKGQPNVPVPIGKSSTNIASVDETIDYLNQLLRTYNKYNSSISVDADKGIFKFTDKFSILTANVNDIEFRRSYDNIGFYCKRDDTCITDVNVTTLASKADRDFYSFGIYVDNGDAHPDTDNAIRKLNTMLATVGSRLGYAASNNSASVNRNLNIINSAFDQYNKYETVFSVEGKKLRWKSTVADIRANFDNITFYINYSNNWIVVKCIEEGCFEGSSYTDEYSMSLKTESGDISPEMENVLDAFNALRREVLSN